MATEINMIVKIQRAICCPNGCVMESCDAPCIASEYETGEAPAILKAMREPTEAMVNKGFDAQFKHRQEDADISSIWQAMIDAVLGKNDG